MDLSFPLNGDQRRVLIEYVAARIDTFPNLADLVENGERGEAERVRSEMSDHLALLQQLGVSLDAGPMTLTLPAGVPERLAPSLFAQARVLVSSEAEERARKCEDWHLSDILLETTGSLLSFVLEHSRAASRDDIS